MIHMRKAKGIVIAIIAAAAVIIVTAGVYFLVLPEIAFFYADAEEPEGFTLELKIAGAGYRLRRESIGSEVLDSPELLVSLMGSCDSDCMLLSGEVAWFVQKTDFRSDDDGPVVMAICQDDRRGQFDIAFQYSPLSGWDDAAAWLETEKMKAVVIVTEETAGLEEVFGSSGLFSFIDASPDSMRIQDRTMTLYQSFGADVICAPYMPQISAFLGKGIAAKWIADSSLARSIHSEFLIGEIDDDIFQTIRPVLKSGARHADTTLMLPLERSFYRNKR
jgi:hypothetical protein